MEQQSKLGQNASKVTSHVLRINGIHIWHCFIAPGKIFKQSLLFLKKKCHLPNKCFSLKDESDLWNILVRVLFYKIASDVANEMIFCVTDGYLREKLDHCNKHESYFRHEKEWRCIHALQHLIHSNNIYHSFQKTIHPNCIYYCQKKKKKIFTTIYYNFYFVIMWRSNLFDTLFISGSGQGWWDLATAMTNVYKVGTDMAYYQFRFWGQMFVYFPKTIYESKLHLGSYFLL